MTTQSLRNFCERVLAPPEDCEENSKPNPRAVGFIAFHGIMTPKLTHRRGESCPHRKTSAGLQYGWASAALRCRHPPQPVPSKAKVCGLFDVEIKSAGAEFHETDIPKKWCACVFIRGGIAIMGIIMMQSGAVVRSQSCNSALCHSETL